MIKQENKSKWMSRKLVVWSTWTILVVFTILAGRENISIDNIISFYGFISLTYIGGNVLQKYIDTGFLARKK